MRPALALIAATALLTGCATPPEPTPGGPPPMAQNGNDCAVIAAVAKEHYRFNSTDNRPPPLRFEDGYAPRCDWSRHGLAFEAFDPDGTGDPRQRVRWVSFARPVYDGGGALVATGIMHGPLAGMGYECRVISGFAAWTVSECRNTWVS
ncbi:MAG: hypothetical protein PSV23_13415 [Brevundimonas sp.]|uniref:hypothetical protein n=1 Tax=Brevundimonas sp. TaxID=1871086 RepID=UPI00248A257E|nr:hypothetical protein [Brevundimonas sp.]MDI1327783.1 hypothetical protein [Brevundimonas sp.]